MRFVQNRRVSVVGDANSESVAFSRFAQARHGKGRRSARRDSNQHIVGIDSMFSDELNRVMRLILCAFARLQQRILPASYQQPQPVFGPAKGWNKLGAI